MKSGSVEGENEIAALLSNVAKQSLVSVADLSALIASLPSTGIIAIQ
jgi:hypothetical protein